MSDQLKMFRFVDFLPQLPSPRRAITDIQCLLCGEMVPVERFREHRDDHLQPEVSQ